MPEILECENLSVDCYGILTGLMTKKVGIFGNEIFLTFVIWME